MQIKGLIGWVAWVGLACVLVLGAVNRTRSASVETSSASRLSRLGDEAHTNSERFSQLPNPQHTPAAVNPAGEQEQDWESQPAVVLAVSAQELVLALPETPEVHVTGRVWRYAQEQGFEAQVGDQLLVSIYYPTPEQIEIVRLENPSRGISVQLQDWDGRPAWSGGRRQADQSVTP